MTPAGARLLARERTRRRSPASIIATTAFAIVAAAVLCTHVPPGFTRTRARLITVPRPAERGVVSVTVPDLTRLGPAPLALVARVSATDAATTSLEVTLNGRRVAAIDVAPGASARVATALDHVPAAGEVVELRAAHDGWRVTSLDIANAFTSAGGPLALSVVPRGQPLPTIPWTLGLPAIAWLAFSAARWRWAHTGVRRAHHVLVTAVGVLLVATLASDLVTPYRLLLSPWLFVLCALAVALPAVPSLLARLSASGRTTREDGVRNASLVPVACALLLAIGIGVLGWTRGSHVAGGADSSGYVSQSRMFAEGRLREPQLLAADLPDGIEPFMAAPLGWTPDRAHDPRGHLVPVYSPGLPLLMAGARVVAGPDALYLVVPIMAALAVWVTFVLGRRLAGNAVGVVAACRLASSPAFLLSMLNPMSDVPVTAWWLIAITLACGTRRRSAAAAGAATAMAVLTRPNLAPLAVIVWILVLARPVTSRAARVSAAAAFATTAGAGALVVGALFTYWYGSPFLSGYGSLDVLFSAANIVPNLARYPRWFVASQTVIGAVGVLGPIWLWRRPAREDAPDAVRIAWILLAFAAAVWACYLTYTPFESWDYLRFVLPSYPVLAVLGAVVLVGAARATPWPTLAVVTLTALLAVHGYRYMDRQGAFEIARAEARYRNVAEFAAGFGMRTAFVAMQHSGSLHYYAERPILRYDLLPPDRLEAAVAELEARGYVVYAVLDGIEQPVFRARFAPHGRLGALDWAPAAVAHGAMGTTIWKLAPDSAATSVTVPIP